MKKKIIILTSALLILGLAIVAYSVTKSTTTLNTPDSCCAMKDCCKDGVCKMGCCKDGKCDMQAHKKDGEATAMKGDCCKGHDSCPMHKGENKDKKDN